MPKQYVKIIELANMSLIQDIKQRIEKCKDDVNEENDDGDTAVIVAARRNDLVLLRYLFSVGGSADVKDIFDHSPTFWATRNNNTEMVELINAQLKNK